MWAKYQRTHNHRSDCRDQNGPGRHILGLGGEGVKVWGNQIDEELDRGVQRFRSPYAHDRKRNQNPFGGRNPEQRPCGDDQDGSHGVNPGVVLGLQQYLEAAESVAETAQASGQIRGLHRQGELNWVDGDSEIMPD